MARSLNLEDLLPLIDRLADGAWHSGEALGEDAGLTRAGLAKRVERLSALGLAVEARQGLGYRLLAPLHRLDARTLRAEAPRGLKVKLLAEIDSTNRALLDTDPQDDPQALLAEFQSAGRGRRGRAWCSPFGANLYLSIAWTFTSWPPQLPALSLAVGVACARVLREMSLEGARLKWPNDILVSDRKLGGILIEHRGEAAGNCRVVIGIGLNVAMQAAQAGEVDQPWIALDEALAQLGAAPVSRTHLAVALLRALHALLSEYPARGFESCRADWQGFDALRDRKVRVLAEPEYYGIARGVDADGALIVETAKGRRAVHAGEVSLRAA